MGEALSDRSISDNSAFGDPFVHNNYNPLNIFIYDIGDHLTGYHPIRFCPFCGEEITVEDAE